MGLGDALVGVVLFFGHNVQGTVLHIAVVEPIGVVLYLSAEPAAAHWKKRLMMPFAAVQCAVGIEFIRPDKLVVYIARRQRCQVFVEEIVDVGGHLIVVVVAVDLDQDPVEIYSLRRRRGIDIKIVVRVGQKVESDFLPLVQKDGLGHGNLILPRIQSVSILQLEGHLIGSVSCNARGGHVDLEGECRVGGDVEFVSGIEADVAPGSAKVAVLQNCGRGVDALHGRIAEIGVEDAVDGCPAGDVSVSFKIVLDILGE